MSGGYGAPPVAVAAPPTVQLPGTGLAIPERLAFARPLVAAAMAEEVRRGNPVSHVYLTARRGWATPGNPLNRPGWHTMKQFEWAVRTAQYGSASDGTLAIRQYPLGTLLRLDARVLHAAPEIPYPGGERSFIKVSFSRDRYNLAGNSHNYLLDYSWRLYPRGAVRNDPAMAGQDGHPVGDNDA